MVKVADSYLKLKGIHPDLPQKKETEKGDQTRFCMKDTTMVRTKNGEQKEMNH